MSFLPFVLSFLLILVLGSSILFNSFRSTTLEKTIILAQNKAKLCLMSQQAVTEFKKLAKRKLPEKKPPKPPKNGKKESVYPDKRNQRIGLEPSKFNLWPLFKKENNTLSDALYKGAIRLIQILYQDAEFYKAARDPGLARRIVDEIISKKGEDFSQLFPENDLAGIYYKMLKGTNTGYPSLEEYFKIDKNEKCPLNWKYASTSILQAIFGESVTTRILAAEKASWETNHRKRVLTKEELRKLLQNSSDSEFEINNLETLFCFENIRKGPPHLYIEEKSKVLAIK